MSNLQTIFARSEIKYKLTKNQHISLCAVMRNYMQQDEYGRHKISNIYFDTQDYKIIRHSIEKPKYKEKLRLRIYGEPKSDNNAFIELKKKFNGTVYKRRILSSQNDACDYLISKKPLCENSQIKNEIDYFISNKGELLPKVYLSYEREAYFCKADENLRITFDFNIKMRDSEISLFASENDISVLDDNYVLMEVKTLNGLPFWLVNFLSKNKIYKTSFSKYGVGYEQFILPKYLNTRRASNV